MVSSSKEPVENAWLITITTSLFLFYVSIQLSLFNAIDIQLMQEFHLNARELGKLSSVYFYANAIMLFPAGILLDRFSTKKILLFAMTMTIVGTFLFGMATTYLFAAAGRFLIGLSAAFCFLGCFRTATRWFPPGKTALVSGIIITMAMMGELIAQTPMAILSNLVGWRNAVLMDAGLGVIIFLAILMIVQDYPSKLMPQKQHFGLLQSLKKVLFNYQNWLAGIYTSLLNLPIFLLGALWGIHYLREMHHLSLLQGSYATTLLFIGVIFGSPFFGWVSDAIGQYVLPMLIGAISSLMVILFLMFVPNLSLGTILLLFFLLGFVTSSQILSYPMIAQINPTTITSTAIGVISTTIMISGMICQPLFGWLMELHWDHTMNNGVPAYTHSDMLNAMMIMPIAFIIGFCIVLMWHKNKVQALLRIIMLYLNKKPQNKLHLYTGGNQQ